MSNNVNLIEIRVSIVKSTGNLKMNHHFLISSLKSKRKKIQKNDDEIKNRRKLFYLPCYRKI